MYVIIGFGLTGILIIAAGVLIREFKFYNLMAGYNTMPPEKKKAYNPEPLAKKLGLFLYCFGSITVIVGMVLYSLRHLKLAVLFITSGYSFITIIAVIVFIIKETKNLNDM